MNQSDAFTYYNSTVIKIEYVVEVQSNSPILHHFDRNKDNADRIRIRTFDCSHRILLVLKSSINSIQYYLWCLIFFAITPLKIGVVSV